jgi:hypothetical protein
MAVARTLTANLGWEQPVEYEDLFIETETNEGSLDKVGFVVSIAMRLRRCSPSAVMYIVKEEEFCTAVRDSRDIWSLAT